jgi:hypothetical protein
MTQDKNEEFVSREDYIRDTRAALRDRGKYVAMIVKELDARGLPTDEIITSAIHKIGIQMGKKVGPIPQADEFIRRQMSSSLGQKAFTTERVQMTPEKAILRTNFCPFVEVWKEIGLSDKEVSRMCDLLEVRDEGRVEEAGLNLDVPHTIARGEAYCEFIFTKKEENS